MLSQGGRQGIHSNWLCRVQGQVASALEILGPPEAPWKSLGPTMAFLPETSGGAGERGRGDSQ